MSSVTHDFIENGIHEFPFLLNQDACKALLDGAKATRVFGPDLFLSQAAFDADPQFKGVNPQPGRNLLHTLSEKAHFVEGHAGLRAGLSELLGPHYEILDKKFVCGVPESWIPDWLKARLLGNPVNNLGAYIKPQYRDITYFYGIDYHQDIIDWKDRSANFVTMYVYLDEVTAHDAPLFVLARSHKFGATIFPHKLNKINDHPIVWRYSDDVGNAMECEQQALLGPAGYVAMWHSALLHGTQPDTADQARLSLRYLVTKPDVTDRFGIDEVNDTLSGRLSLGTTRVDLNAEGAAVVKANTINTVR